MRIIDFERKGNLVRFYLGKDSISNYSGDGWGKYPYDRAELVDDQFVAGTADIAFPFDTLVLEPACESDFCGYSKDDMKAGIIPCIIVVPASVRDGSVRTQFSNWSSSRDVLKFYFNDRMDPTNGLSIYRFDPREQQLQREQAAAFVTRAMEGVSVSGEKPSAIPLWEKHNLTIQEAAAYFGIGQQKIRALTDIRNCSFVLFVGNKRLIKRQAFEKYLDGQYSL